MIVAFFMATLNLLSIMSPYMLLGFGIACLLRRFLPPEWVFRHLGREGWPQIVKASLLGLPLPLCSCGVLPVSLSLRQSGAGYGATISFLISTPQISIDGVLTTYSLLGPFIVVSRVIGALASGILGGLLMLIFGTARTSVTVSTCCETSCSAVEPPPAQTWKSALDFATRKLPYGVSVPFLAGVLLSALLMLITPPNFFVEHLPDGIWNYLIMILIGLPMYTCSTGAVPIAAWLIYSGMSPGAALVFLMTGPATSFAVILTLIKALGRIAVCCYLGAIAFGALITGMLIDFLFKDTAALMIPAYLQQCTDCVDGTSVFSWVAVAALLSLFAYARFPRKN